MTTKKPPKLTKEEIFWQVMNAAITLDFQKGHQRWTISELSRLSKVSRPLIYYYFGKSRLGILMEAVKLVGEEFLGLSPQRLSMWQNKQLLESVHLSRKLYAENPQIGAFYLINRTKPTEIGLALKKLETEYLTKLGKFFPQISLDGRRAIHAALFGLVLTPDLTEEAVKQVVEAVFHLSSN